MEALANKLSWKNIEKWLSGAEGKRFLTCITVTFIWGLVAHAYAFLNATLAHDGLCIYADNYENDWKISLGRIVIPLYRAFTQNGLAMPWVVGLLAMTWISLAVYLIVKVFDFRSLPIIVLVAGIFTTNYTVTALASSYIHDVDADMFAMLMAVLAVYFWRQNKSRKCFLIGAFPAAIALGIYQSYISVTVVLVMLICIMDIVEGKRLKAVFCSGLKAIAMLLLAGVIYAIALAIVLKIKGIALTTDRVNALTNMVEINNTPLLQRLYDTYRYSGITYFVKPISGYNEKFMGIVNLLLIGSGVAIAFGVLLSKRGNILEKLLLLALGILLPLGINITCFMGGPGKILTLYAAWLIYLLVLLLVRWGASVLQSESKANLLKMVTGILMMIILVGNVQTSNAAYLKKDLEKQTTLSTMTRIVERMESVDEYKAGETPVLFVNVNKKAIDNFRKYNSLQGLEYNLVIDGSRTIKDYFKYILNEPINVFGMSDTIEDKVENAKKEVEMKKREEVKSLPIFPAEGSIAFVDDVLVVKMG